MNNNNKNLDSSENNIEQNNKEESSIYSDACSNSLELQLLHKKNEMKQSQINIEEKEEKKNIYDNNDIIEKVKEDLNQNLEFKDSLINGYNNNTFISRNLKKKYSYKSDNNMISSNSNSSFSISDTSLNKRRGSGVSFSSTKSSLLSKINIKI